MKTVIFDPSMIQDEYHIPKIFHYIWVGGQIPEEYLEHIRYFSGICAKNKYNVKIWVDTTSYYENRDVLYNIENLTLCRTEDLLKNFAKDQKSGYTESEKEYFIKSIYFEYLSPANYAAVSDFLRIEVLRQEGGIYLDTDTMLHTYEKKENIVLNIDFSTIRKIGIAHTERNNNLIVASANHPALITTMKMMIEKMTEQHGLSKIEFIALSEALQEATSNKDGENLSDRKRKKYFKSEHCWLISKKSLNIIPYRDIGHEVNSYDAWSYHQSLITGKLTYAPLRWHLTIIIGPESLQKTVIAWQNFLEDNNIVSIHECFTAMEPLDKFFNTTRCDSTWCNESSFVRIGSFERLEQSNPEQETTVLEESVCLFEERVVPLTFSDLSKRLDDFPERVVEKPEVYHRKNSYPFTG